MDEQILNVLSQFGAAGLIGLLWIAERRSASRRDRQLGEAHRKLQSQTHAIDAILNVVKDNTRALVRLEQTQRQMIDLAQQLGRRLHRRTPDA